MGSASTFEQLWDKFLGVTSRMSQIKSLTGRSWHKIISVDSSNREYRIAYPTGNQKNISFKELYEMYCELMDNGYLDCPYMAKNYRKVLKRWKAWTAPGSAMLAILPLLDERIRVDGGKIFL